MAGILKKRNAIVILGSFICLLTAAGCQSARQAPVSKFVFNEPHMGTVFSITLYAPDADAATQAAEAAFRRVAKLDRMMTDYDTNSELMRLCLTPVGQPKQVSAELFQILKESQRVARETDGSFDITVGPLVRAWRAARKTHRLPAAEEIAEMRKSIGWQKFRLDARGQTVTLLAPHMQLDLGGIAKGYAADQALVVIRSMGIRSALVAASGDIAIGDAPPGKRGWKVGIEQLGGAPNELVRSVILHNAGISTSGGTEQFVEINGVRYSHIIDPATGLGMTNRIQTTIIGPNATITDGLDTPTAIMGVKRALALVDSQPRLAAFIITQDAEGRHYYASRKFRQRFGAE